MRKRTAADLPRGNESPAIVRRDENKRLRERLTAGRERAKSELKSDHTRDERVGWRTNITPERVIFSHYFSEQNASIILLHREIKVTLFLFPRFFPPIVIHIHHR